MSISTLFRIFERINQSWKRTLSEALDLVYVSGNIERSPLTLRFQTGQEFRDSIYLLSTKNTRRIKTNMVFILSLGFQDLVDDQGQKYGPLTLARAPSLKLFLIRYALQLNDTVIVNSKRPATCLTDGLKKPKHVMFFSDDASEEEDTKASTKKGVNGNPSPLKNKTAGGKVLRNKTRNAGQEETVQSTATKIAEHQKELHAQLHKNGLAKYSEGGSGAGGKEGQGWKKFQSYKGELGLPKEVEGLRVGTVFLHYENPTHEFSFRFSLIEKRRPLSYRFMVLLSLSI